MPASALYGFTLCRAGHAVTAASRKSENRNRHAHSTSHHFDYRTRVPSCATAESEFGSRNATRAMCTKSRKTYKTIAAAFGNILSAGNESSCSRAMHRTWPRSRSLVPICQCANVRVPVVILNCSYLYRIVKTNSAHILKTPACPWATSRYSLV